MKLKFLLVLAAISLVVRTAGAQTVRGQVVEATSGAPVPGGFVTLVGADGKELMRTLTDQDGRFSLRAPAAGRYRLRSERIGFKLHTSPDIELAADQTLDYRLAVAAIPIRLEEIRVAGDTKCRIRPEEGRATATVWEEARKALAAVSWMQNQQKFNVKVRTYEREMGTDLHISQERSQVRYGTAYRPFRAASAAMLAESGYVQRASDGSYTFQAPDADVLFSDEFLNRHCFRLETVRDSSRSGMIGLGFEPTGGARIPEIRGVMWLDEKSAELRYVEFNYLNHGLQVQSDLLGGRVEFAKLSNGGWLVNRYWIRMPKVQVVHEKRYSSMGQLSRGGGTDESHPELVGLMEDGGEVLEATASDGTRLVSSLGASIKGTVFDSTRNIPLIGAQVRLTGTSYTTESGPGGEFRMEGLPDGIFSIEFIHRDFPAWGVLHGPASVKLERGAVAVFDLAVPSLAGLFRLICPDTKGDTLGAVAGVVRDSATGSPVRDAVVQVSWRTYDAVTAGFVSGKKLGMEVGSDSTGYFRACGLPVGRPMQAAVVTRGEEGKPSEDFKVNPQEIVELKLKN